jgi:hypothetical protein
VPDPNDGGCDRTESPQPTAGGMASAVLGSADRCPYGPEHRDAEGGGQHQDLGAKSLQPDHVACRASRRGFVGGQGASSDWLGAESPLLGVGAEPSSAAG